MFPRECSISLSSNSHFLLGQSENCGPAATILKVWPWRDKKSSPRCLEVRSHFPSSSCIVERSPESTIPSRTTGFPPLLQLVTSFSFVFVVALSHFLPLFSYALFLFHLSPVLFFSFFFIYATFPSLPLFFSHYNFPS